MDIMLLMTFIGLNITNVIIQTVKSIATVKCGKAVAALVNAIAYGLYTVVTVYMLCELPLLWKAIIVASCNLVGVFCVKWAEEKMRKDKLWKIEVTVPHDEIEPIKLVSDRLGLSYNYIDIKEYGIFNFYCKTQKESRELKEGLSFFHVKYFVTEAKTTLL